jgi:hypothetical protein
VQAVAPFAPLLAALLLMMHHSSAVPSDFAFEPSSENSLATEPRDFANEQFGQLAALFGVTEAALKELAGVNVLAAVSALKIAVEAASALPKTVRPACAYATHAGMSQSLLFTNGVCLVAAQHCHVQQSIQQGCHRGAIVLCCHLAEILCLHKD